MMPVECALIMDCDQGKRVKIDIVVKKDHHIILLLSGIGGA